MKKFSLILGLVFTLFTTLCFNLKAEELATNNNTNNNNWYNNLYVGVGAGNFSKSKQYNGWKDIEDSTPIIFQNNLSIILGYSLFKYLDIELGYINFLKHKEEYSSTTGTYSGNNFNFSLKPKLIIGKSTLFVNLGIDYNFVTENYFSHFSSNVDIYKNKSYGYFSYIGYSYELFNNHTLGIKYGYHYINDVEPDNTLNDTLEHNNIIVFYQHSFK